jgi:16S rRNA (guanine527-N7)-methyltransferase
MNLPRQLSTGLDDLGLTIAAETQLRMLRYIELIGKWNRVYNLTAIRELPTMVSAHLLDSLAVAPHLSARTILDVGSGAGLPGIPLAMIWPQSQITLLDSNQKKTTFMQQACIELELKNVEVVCARTESWHSPKKFDLVISRAFAELADFVRVAAAHCTPTGLLAAMKGILPADEIHAVAVNSALPSVIELHVPGLNAERHLVLIKP